MHVGFASMNNVENLRPDDLAGALEERGYESLWIGEHSHIPVARKTPYPAGGELPEPYTRMMDPYVSLMAAASTTTELTLATGIALPLERPVLVAAKEIATLDHLSGGRVVLGVGTGWNVEELANLSTVPWRRRFRAIEEQVEAMRVLWSADEAEFHGEFVDFGPVWSFPKPLQSPRPPILMAGNGTMAITHAVRWADGWYPVDIAFRDVARGLSRMAAIADEAGRDPATLPVTLNVWNAAEDKLKRYRDLGVERVVIGGVEASLDGAAATRRYLDRFAKVIPELSS